MENSPPGIQTMPSGPSPEGAEPLSIVSLNADAVGVAVASGLFFRAALKATTPTTVIVIAIITTALQRRAGAIRRRDDIVLLARALLMYYYLYYYLALPERIRYAI